MNKTYLHLVSNSKSMPTATNTQKFSSHSQKLDSLLDELEAEYGLKSSKSKTKLDENDNNNDATDFAKKVELDQEELKLWEMAKSIKKHNAGYRTAAKLLRELQQEQQSCNSKGLLPAASVTVSTTSCSSLEDGVYQDIANDDKCQDTKHTASPFSNTYINKRVTFNQNDNKSSSSAIMLQSKKSKTTTTELRQVQHQARKATTTTTVDKPSIIMKPSEIRFATPTLASSAKAKAKSNLTMSCPMKNSDTSTTITKNGNFKKKSSNSEVSIVLNSLQNKKEEAKVDKVKVNSARIPTLSSRHKLNPPLPPSTKPSIVQLSPHKKLVPNGKTSGPPPPPKTTSKLKLPSETRLKFRPPPETIIHHPEVTSNALDIIRNLLEHAKSAAMTLFDIKDESSNDEQEPASFVIDTKSTIFGPNPTQAVKLKEESNEQWVNRKRVQTLFGVPYIPGASKIPKPTYLLS